MKSTYLKISILLSIISIGITLFINNQIAKAYLKSHGKMRALFGLKELLQFAYQYYVAILGFIALIFVIPSIKGNNQKSKTLAAVLLSLLAIIVVFARIWRLFV